MCVSFRNSTDFFEAVQPRVAIFRITGFWLLAQFFGRLTYFNFSTRIFVFKTLASTGYCHSSNNHLQPLLGTETMDSDSGHHSWHGSQDHTERLEPLQPPSLPPFRYREPIIIIMLMKHIFFVAPAKKYCSPPFSEKFGVYIFKLYSKYNENIFLFCFFSFCSQLTFDAAFFHQKRFNRTAIFYWSPVKIIKAS